MPCSSGRGEHGRSTCAAPQHGRPRTTPPSSTTAWWLRSPRQAGARTAGRDLRSWRRPNSRLARSRTRGAQQCPSPDQVARCDGLQACQERSSTPAIFSRHLVRNRRAQRAPTIALVRLRTHGIFAANVARAANMSPSTLSKIPSTATGTRHPPRQHGSPSCWSYPSTSYLRASMSGETILPLSRVTIRPRHELERWSIPAERSTRGARCRLRPACSRSAPRTPTSHACRPGALRAHLLRARPQRSWRERVPSVLVRTDIGADRSSTPHRSKSDGEVVAGVWALSPRHRYAATSSSRKAALSSPRTSRSRPASHPPSPAQR